MALTSKQRAALRSAANTMDPVYQIGKGEIDETLKQGIADCIEEDALEGYRTLGSPMEVIDRLLMPAMERVGTLFGEAVVITRPELMPHFFTLVKQHGALLAKGRLLGVQFETLFTDNLYLRIARQAITTARKLKEAFRARGYRLWIDSPTNQQFFVLPNQEIERLSQYASFEVWGPRGEEESIVRFVTSWATDERQIDELIARL